MKSIIVPLFPRVEDSEVNIYDVPCGVLAQISIACDVVGEGGQRKHGYQWCVSTTLFYTTMVSWRLSGKFHGVKNLPCFIVDCVWRGVYEYVDEG